MPSSSAPGQVAVNDRADNPVRFVPGANEETEGSVEGDFTAGFEHLLGFNHLANCDLPNGSAGRSLPRCG